MVQTAFGNQLASDSQVVLWDSTRQLKQSLQRVLIACLWDLRPTYLDSVSS